MGMPATSCATAAWVCPATIASTRPAGSCLASLKISASLSHDERSMESSKRAHHPPACARATTISAPRSRSRVASISTVAASGAVASPWMLAASVMVSPW